MAEEITLPRKDRPSRWHRPIWWANVLAAAVLLVTYLAPDISPVRAWWLALLAMTYPFQLLLHGFFIIYWLFFRRRRMLLSIVIIVLGWPHIGDHYQVFGKQAPEAEIAGTPFKLMSWNVRLFDLYNWSGNKVTRDSIFSVLHRERPDILCLQEFFYSPDPRFFRTKEALMQEFEFNALHDRYTHKARHDQHFGIATFSVYPIIDTGSIHFPENPNNQCIWSTVVVRGDTIRVYNAHLASYHFGDEDYKFLEGLEAGTNHRDSLRTGGVRILKRLRRGVKLRASEVERIADHISDSPHPVIYCGDMNDVPMSYSYTQLREHLQDAFVHSGRGHGGTYIGKLPSIRIDHLLYGPQLESWDMHTLPEKLSDHHALVSNFAVRPKE